MTLWFLLLSFIPFAVMVVFVRRNVSEGLVELAAAEAEAQARFLSTSIADSAPVGGYGALASLRSSPDHTAAVLNPDGTFTWHRDEAKVGASAEDDLGPNAVARALSGESGNFVDPEGGYVLGYSPLSESGGTVLVAVELRLVDTILRQLEQSSSVQLALSLAVASVAGGVAIWIVIGPIQRLTDAAEEIGAGNLDVTIDSSSMEGELEVLAEAFTKMARQLRGWYAELERRVQDRTRELASMGDAEHKRAEQFKLISDVGRRIASIRSVDELLDQVVVLIRDAYDFHHVGIGLLEDDEVVYQAGAGELWDDPSYDFEPGRLKVGGESLTGWVAQSGEPLIVPDVTIEPRYVEMRGSGTQSELLVPIITKGRVIGILDVQSDQLDAFSGADLAVLRSLADQAGVAIDNARLYERTRQLAVIEERQRLARDLHDSVTQSMYGVTLYAEAAIRLLHAGNEPQAAEHLVQLRQTAQEALQEMRLLIFELRPPVLVEEGLVAGVQARLDAVEGRSGVATTLTAELPEPLSVETEEALYRIAQEALNNALKHAHARRIEVDLRQVGDITVLEVRDDGTGFETVGAELGGGLGLRGMAERAAELGGEIGFDSRPGEGTLVRVEVPT